MEDFIATRDQLKQYLIEKGLITELVLRSDTSRTTVYDTFKIKSESELKGKTFKVWNCAIELVTESKTAVLRAANALTDE